MVLFLQLWLRVKPEVDLILTNLKYSLVELEARAMIDEVGRFFKRKGHYRDLLESKDSYLARFGTALRNVKEIASAIWVSAAAPYADRCTFRSTAEAF
jgi:hypothetical protein